MNLRQLLPGTCRSRMTKIAEIKEIWMKNHTEKQTDRPRDKQKYRARIYSSQPSLVFRWKTKEYLAIQFPNLKERWAGTVCVHPGDALEAAMVDRGRMRERRQGAVAATATAAARHRSRRGSSSSHQPPPPHPSVSVRHLRSATPLVQIIDSPVLHVCGRACESFQSVARQQWLQSSHLFIRYIYDC